MNYLTALVLLTCLGVACAIFAPRILHIFGEGRAAQLAVTIMEQAERLALDAIGFAEERARDELKKTGRKLSGAAKLNLAIVFFRDHAGERVLEMFPRGVGDWIEAKLGMVRGIAPIVGHAGPGIGHVVETFVPSVGTVRSCIDCSELVVGGPTRCTPCASRVSDVEDTKLA